MSPLPPGAFRHLGYMSRVPLEGTCIGPKTAVGSHSPALPKASAAAAVWPCFPPSLNSHPGSPSLHRPKATQPGTNTTNSNLHYHSLAAHTRPHPRPPLPHTTIYQHLVSATQHYYCHRLPPGPPPSFPPVPARGTRPAAFRQTSTSSTPCPVQSSQSSLVLS